MQKNKYFCFIWLILISACHFKSDKSESPVSLSHCKKNKYASYFRIYEEASFHALVCYINSKKTDSVIYVVYDDKKPELKSNAFYIKTPVHSVASFSSVFIGALRNLQVLPSIQVIDNADYICNAFIRKKCEKHQIFEVNKNGVLNLEQLLVCKPALILTNPGLNASSDFDERLLKNGIIPVVCADYLENSPLARAEWINALALFFKAGHKADSVFEQIEKKYLQLKQLACHAAIKPSVFTEVKNGDVWFVPGAKSYVACLLQDAGSSYLFCNNNKTGSLSLPLEQVVHMAANADYWLHLHDVRSAEDLLKQDSRYGQFKAFKTRHLYNNNALSYSGGANAYWEEGLNHPDELLADLIKIFHSELLPDHTLKYYKAIP